MGEGGAFLAGSIVGKLLLDKTGWNSSVTDVQKDEAKLTGVAGKIGAAAKGIGTAFTVAGGAIVGVLGAMIFKVVDTGESLSKLSKQTGISVETLSALRLAAETNETSLEGIATGMKKLSLAMVEADDKGSKAAFMFKYLNIDARDSHGVMRDMSEVMLDVADKFAGMEDGAEKNTIAMQLFGKSGLDLIPMLNTGSKAIKEQMEEAKKLGLVMSKEAAEGADEFGDKVTTLKLALKASTEHLVLSLMPTLTHLVDKIKDVIGKVTAWMSAHPGLTDAIAKTAGALGLIMMVLGPMLLLLPKIIDGFRVMKGFELGSKFTSQFTGLGASLGEAGVSGVLKKLPMIAGAAFVGWKIGQLIGEVTGLNGVIGGLFDKLYAKKAEGSPIEYLAGHFDAAAKRADILSAASELVGKKITGISDAQQILITQYKEHGTTGSATLDAMVVEWDKNLTAVKTVGGVHKTTMADMEAETKAAAKAEEDWANWIVSTGIVTMDNQAKAFKEAKDHLQRLDDLLKTGKLTQENYAKGVQAINDELKKTGQLLPGILPPARDLNGIMHLAAPAFADANTFAYKYQQTLEKLGILTIRQTIDKTRELIREQKDLKDAFDKGDISAEEYAKGMQKVQGDIRGVTTETTTATETMSSEWDGFFNEVGSKWGDLIGQFVDSFKEGDPMSIVTLWNRGWKAIRETFFQVIGEMIASELVKQFKKLLVDLFTDVGKEAVNMGKKILDSGKTSEGALGGVGKALGPSGLGGAITGIATTIAKVMTTLATGLATVLTTLATGIATAIVTIATGIATAATTLAAAAPALMIVGAIALALYAGFAAINKFIAGGGGGGAGDGMGRVVERQDRFLAGWDWWHTAVADILAFQQGQNDTMVDRLDWIGNLLAGQVTDAIKAIGDAIGGLTGAQAGMVVQEPMLLKVGEQAPRIPEIVAPLPALAGAFQEGGGSQQVVLNFSPTYNISAIDGNSVRDVVRNKIMPETIAALRANFGKMLLQEALGV